MQCVSILLALEFTDDVSLFNSFLTDDNTERFCGQCRPQIRLHKMCSLISDLHCPRFHSRLELTLSQTTNFGLFQTERVCRPQFEIL